MAKDSLKGSLLRALTHTCSKTDTHIFLLACSNRNGNSQLNSPLTSVPDDSILFYYSWAIKDYLNGHQIVSPGRETVFLIISQDMCSSCIEENIGYLIENEITSKYNKAILINGLSKDFVRDQFSVPKGISIHNIKSKKLEDFLVNPYWGVTDSSGYIENIYLSGKNNSNLNKAWWEYIQQKQDL
ncbi:hypothetical protein KZP23_10540 [Echinicola marina]|uniref:hypothetical protein n=1 Tax=Echinicola marina TaxID=2859768 RepID=UPI001CF6D818|nr:hypothetical protein [Echinicola marina]UCS95410.1 hypothetical protein KZP23_10540 [Echinicola marina]